MAQRDSPRNHESYYLMVSIMVSTFGHKIQF
nr:MAG TPA: hypothetical protein [Caudoviricetes sp.]